MDPDRKLEYECYGVVRGCRANDLDLVEDSRDPEKWQVSKYQCAQGGEPGPQAGHQELHILKNFLGGE